MLLIPIFFFKISSQSFSQKIHTLTLYSLFLIDIVLSRPSRGASLLPPLPLLPTCLFLSCPLSLTTTRKVTPAVLGNLHFTESREPCSFSKSPPPSNPDLGMLRSLLFGLLKCACAYHARSSFCPCGGWDKGLMETGTWTSSLLFYLLTTRLGPYLLSSPLLSALHASPRGTQHGAVSHTRSLLPATKTACNPNMKTALHLSQLRLQTELQANQDYIVLRPCLPE